MELPAFELSPSAIAVDGKPAVTVCPVQVVVVAKKYSSGSVYYEIKSAVPVKRGGFAILLPRTETVTNEPLPTTETRLHVARKRVTVDNDRIQIHVELELERSDAAGKEHPPMVLATCKTELWGTKTTYIGERRRVDDGGVPEWSAIEERIDKHGREDVESEASAEVTVVAPVEFVPQDKGKITPETP